MPRVGGSAVEASRRRRRNSRAYRDRLVMAHLGLARHLARRAAERYCLRELDDFTSIAYMALLEAASRFDRRRVVKFSTYAHRVIACRILDYLRQLDPVGRAYRERIRAGRAASISVVLFCDVGDAVASFAGSRL